MRDLTYQRPTSLDEAVRLAGVGGTALLAGGQTLLPALRRRQRSAVGLVDLGAVLPRDIGARAGGVRIGAGATHAAIAASELVGTVLPALAALARHVGDPAVRHRGTLGGALAAHEPSGDYPAACLALDTTIHTTERDIPAPDFFTGHRRTALGATEIITGATFPPAQRAAYLKLLDPASRYALVGVFVALTDAGPRVAVTGARRTGAARWPGAEQRLREDPTGERLHGLALPLDDLIEDRAGDAVYRAHLAGVLARRATVVARGPAPGAVAIVHGSPQPPHPRDGARTGPA